MKRTSGAARAILAAAAAAVVLTSCGETTADRASVCKAFDELGKQALSPHPFSDSIIFRKARELGDEAAGYDNSSSVNDEAERVTKIGESNSTSLSEIRSATPAISALCGHPLGIGSTTDQPQAAETTEATTQTSVSTATTNTATSPPSDEEQIRDVMRQWGAATDPAEICSLETAAAQQAEIAKNPGAASCTEAIDPGTAVSYPSIDVTMTVEDVARVEVTGGSVPSYSLIKVNGTWKIDQYGTHVDMGSPDAGPGPGSLEPDSCGAGTGTDC